MNLWFCFSFFFVDLGGGNLASESELLDSEIISATNCIASREDCL